MSAEDRLQIQVAELLDWLAHAWRFMWFAVPNQRGNKTSVGAIMKLKRMGMKTGCPDIHIDREGGQTFKIELKVGKNKQSDKQVEYERECKRLGIGYHLCYSVDEVVKVMEKEFNKKVSGGG